MRRQRRTRLNKIVHLVYELRFLAFPSVRVAEKFNNLQLETDF